ncbi:LysR family transcriptional regulator [Halioglobus japonicus]|uniref:Transcriptional regulator GcvA n=1 Tax=Halioglobus japonicus TaxID=930805 RepID=A0AAP8MEQ8_9GAMM|nr:transcriptional regulator GcvA [Halioglobus japonicus]AQA18165.1 LysR family transcriptional regulator [Halioglobus japonicus]PLW86167.1 transcriptional regulator GcvA [Halioglobus japonicus]GHD14100.1 transcriptional regulator [Halioglobus japonicus]
MSGFQQRRKLPPLNALRAFEAAARHQSFKEAAEELAVSQSAVSHQIKALEEYLSTSLFTRRTRAVELTRKGKLLYPILRNAFDSIWEGTQMLLEETSVSVLTLHVYSTFTMRWLLPRLPRFQEANPNIQVRLHTSQADVNFAQEDIDAAIMVGHPSDSNLHYDYLFDCELFPVCSPGYLEKHGPINTPQELANHPILQVYPSAGDWHVWLEGNEVTGVAPDSGLQLESYDVALSSAVQGIGIALGQQPYLEGELETGDLVELFPELRMPNTNRWYLACRTEKRDTAKLEALRQWLISEVESDPNLPQLSKG